MERHLDRLMRSISATRMRYSSFSLWEPPVDLYESDSTLTVFMDVAGIDTNQLRIVAEPKLLKISGERRCDIAGITCVHQLEIEYGRFERIIQLPKSIDVSATISESKNGFLVVKMPLLKIQGKIEVNVK